MKKSLLIVLAAVCVSVLCAACASTQEDQNEANKLREDFINNRPAEAYVVTGDESVDNIAEEQAKVYGFLIKEIDARQELLRGEGAELYLQYTSMAKDNMKQGMAKEEAYKKAWDDFLSNDENDKAKNAIIYYMEKDDFKNWQSPEKYQRLLSIQQSGLKIASTASNLKDSFKGFDASTLKKIQSVVCVLKQTEYIAKGTDYLIYQINQDKDCKEYINQNREKAE